MITKIILMLAILILTIAAIIINYRLIKGPNIVDRIAAVDTFSAIVIGLLITIACLTKFQYILSTAVTLGIVSFIGIISLTKYIANQILFEKKKND